YIWLISADDRLRSRDVLARFVAALDDRPAATLVFCPAVRFDSTGELGLYGSVGASDRVYDRFRFADVLTGGNHVCALAATAARTAYQSAGLFPMDLPYVGDWFIWANCAVLGEVVFLAEPMIDRRHHDGNMTLSFLNERAAAMVRDEIDVRWRIR